MLGWKVLMVVGVKKNCISFVVVIIFLCLTAELMQQQHCSQRTAYLRAVYVGDGVVGTAATGDADADADDEDGECSCRRCWFAHQVFFVWYLVDFVWAATAATKCGVGVVVAVTAVAAIDAAICPERADEHIYSYPPAYPLLQLHTHTLWSPKPPLNGIVNIINSIIVVVSASSNSGSISNDWMMLILFFVNITTYRYRFVLVSQANLFRWQ